MANSYTNTIEEQNCMMRQYYIFQSKIYDLTRWSFLFGRRQAIRELPFDREAELSILEVGCGTGYNLRQLARRFPNARLTGLDVSPHMLHKARRATQSLGSRIKLLEKAYTFGDDAHTGQLDAVLFSYSLSMINPQWESLIQQARQDLRAGGFIALADFHNSRFPWFKQHMGNNHVRMDGQLMPVLEREFETLTAEVRLAYGGVWEYCVFVGRK